MDFTGGKTAFEGFPITGCPITIEFPTGNVCLGDSPISVYQAAAKIHLELDGPA